MKRFTHIFSTLFGAGGVAAVAVDIIPSGPVKAVVAVGSALALLFSRIEEMRGTLKK